MDVSQDVIIREEDCGTDRGLKLKIAVKGADGVLRKTEDVETSVYARMLAEDVVVDGKVIAPADVDLGDVLIDALVGAPASRRSRPARSLTRESAVGTCAFCYGRSLATGKLVDIGEAAGIIAAQSIGEPEYPAHRRATFHTGGVAGDRHRPRVCPESVQLFEARAAEGRRPDLRGQGPRADRGDREDQEARRHPGRRQRRDGVPDLEACPSARFRTVVCACRGTPIR
ncbi:DNA-directed RNA polymerase subunit beta' [Streptomyces microflavus]